MKTPTADELKKAARAVRVHSRTIERSDAMALLVTSDVTIRALIDSLWHHAGPKSAGSVEPRAVFIDAVFLTGLELGLRVGHERERAQR
jgi:hypothetical protein